MKTKEKNMKGITLIALVITIIVLIILAGISISMIVGDNGIITQAQRAAKETANVTKASEEEMNTLIEEMEQYIKENNEAENAIERLKAGDYIEYDTGIEGVGKKLFRVLYPKNSEYGLQIISDKNIENVQFGGDNWIAGKESYNNAIKTLNDKAQTYINLEYATDARCVGSIPTVENGIFISKNEGTDTTVILPPPVPEGEDSNNWWTSYTKPDGWDSNDSLCYNTDENYIIDANQMKSANIIQTNEIYWLASRYAPAFSSHCSFDIRIIINDGSLNSNDICRVLAEQGGAYGSLYERGLRPCILLRTDIKIIDGNGKKETPYILGK